MSDQITEECKTLAEISEELKKVANIIDEGFDLTEDIDFVEKVLLETLETSLNKLHQLKEKFIL